jgi:glyoxylase-like metal-dependent hydrolase (beta-lactamase superfamily II)
MVMSLVSFRTHSFARVSRRQFLAASAAVATTAFMPRRLSAAGVVEMMRGGGATAKLSAEKIKGNISAILGSGGNIGVLTGPDGKLLVDAGLAGSEPQLRDALATLSADPIKQLINTHWHFDHTDGNEWLHSAGATITAHRNVLERLSHSTRVDAWDFTFPPSPAGALPTEIVDHEKTLSLNGTTIAIKYYGPAHTDGDLSVHFADDDVLQVGDTFWNGYYPFIDYNTGGSIDGTIRATDLNLSRVSAKTRVIPGHGPVGDKAQLTEYRDMLVTVRNAVATLKQQGKAVDDAIAAKPTAQYDAKWGGFVIGPDVFVQLVYAGV